MKTHTLSLIALALLACSPATTAAIAAEKGSQPATISQGAKIKIAEHLVPGKITIFDFTSKYCPPCVRIAPMLDKLHARHDEIAVVKVDINRPNTKGIDWDSPVARQQGLRSIPHFMIYGPDGKLKAEGEKARDIVMKWLKDLK